MNRRTFIQNTGLAGASLLVSPSLSFSQSENDVFPNVRTVKAERNFTSEAIEKTIRKFKRNVEDQELCWLFENCFPNTLDTTVKHYEQEGKPYTYVITGDIDAMWLRDSSAQVWPYVQFAKKDKALKKLIVGVINRQTSFILKDPYANAFYNDLEKESKWKSDITQMLPGVHERKWEIDSLCYPIRLAYHYWKETGDTTPFDEQWYGAIKLTLQTFREQQLKEGNGPYSFMRETGRGTDTRSMNGYGYPVKPVGLIASAFRPSDDSTVFSFLIPSNYFAVVSLKQAAEMLRALRKDNQLIADIEGLSEEVNIALKEHGVVHHKKYGDIIPYEVDGFGSHLLMDDANVPSLLSLPYLGAIDRDNPLYKNTRNFVLSTDNPFFYKGIAGEGIGGPHQGENMVWPMAIIIRALTSNDNSEIKKCIKMLKETHANTGFMHETFHKDDPNNYTRKWFAWANTLFGELLWKTYTQSPYLLK